MFFKDGNNFKIKKIIETNNINKNNKINVDFRNNFIKIKSLNKKQLNILNINEEVISSERQNINIISFLEK